MEYAIFVLINNESIFNENANKFFKEIDSQKVIIFSDYNQNNRFTSIRSWVNEKLGFIYSNPMQFQNSIIFFIHQDVLPSKNFLDQFKVFSTLIDFSEAGVIGFAGIDEAGNPHMLILDSGMLCYSGETYPLEVVSVDELFFAIPANVLISNEVKLSDISGWHAYAAEFSIILKEKGFRTYYFPIFLTHNSIRNNNYGLLKSHIALFNKYEVSTKTLVGEIKKLDTFQFIKRYLRELYNNYLKFNINPHFSNSLKSLFLDKTRIFPSKFRIINSFLSKDNSLLYTFDSNPVKMPEIEFVLNGNNITIKHYNYSDLDNLICSLPDNKRIFIIGLKKRIKGFHYKSIVNLNYRLR